MFVSLVTSAVSSCIALCGVQPPTDTARCWKLDKTTITVGGCVTIIVNQPSRQAYKYALSIDGDVPIRLAGKMGPVLRSGGRTVILLSHQLFSAEGMQVDNENPELFHMVPLFHSPGIVRLTLLSGDDSLGTQEIRVIDAPDGSRTAIELMFPTLEPKRRDPTAAPLLFQVLMGANLSNILKSHDDAMDRLHWELEIVTKHPDWSDIAAMTVADAEATVHYKSTIEACRQARDEGHELDTEPPIPPSISQALKRNLNSAYDRRSRREELYEA